jgi:hypothetical protein
MRVAKTKQLKPKHLAPMLVCFSLFLLFLLSSLSSKSLLCHTFFLVQAVQQKMTELERSLYNAKQNMQIESVGNVLNHVITTTTSRHKKFNRTPSIVLEFHPDIVKAAQIAEQNNKTLK